MGNKLWDADEDEYEAAPGVQPAWNEPQATHELIHSSRVQSTRVFFCFCSDVAVAFTFSWHVSHAVSVLALISSSASVSDVLAFRHPFVKTRSLKEGTPLSKTKARRSPELLLPYKPRPVTCPALARRLVTGALGVRLPTSREEREAEKKLLTKARGECSLKKQYQKESHCRVFWARDEVAFMSGLRKSYKWKKFINCPRQNVVYFFHSFHRCLSTYYSFSRSWQTCSNS